MPMLHAPIRRVHQRNHPFHPNPDAPPPRPAAARRPAADPAAGPRPAAARRPATASRRPGGWAPTHRRTSHAAPPAPPLGRPSTTSASASTAFASAYDGLRLRPDGLRLASDGLRLRPAAAARPERPFREPCNNSSNSMANDGVQLVSNMNDGEMRKRRKKGKRVVAALVIAIMTMISHWYHRKRPRHIVDPDEVAERDVSTSLNLALQKTSFSGYSWLCMAPQKTSLNLDS
ncbi:hypothetical protein ACP4OV_021218 [Aristida adscensionis]